MLPLSEAEAAEVARMSSYACALDAVEAASAHRACPEAERFLAEAAAVVSGPIAPRSRLRAFAAVRTVSEMNTHEGLAVSRSSRTRSAKWEVVAALCSAFAASDWRRPTGAVLVTMRRRGRPLDDDNIRPALKGCRDAIAAHFGRDDADPRIRFRYDQAPCAGGKEGVEIELAWSFGVCGK